MTPLDIYFRYGQAPGAATLRALDTLRDVYGIRRIVFHEKERTIRLEYDASRLNEATVTALLRHTGLDLQEKLALV